MAVMRSRLPSAGFVRRRPKMTHHDRRRRVGTARLDAWDVWFRLPQAMAAVAFGGSSAGALRCRGALAGGVWIYELENKKGNRERARVRGSLCRGPAFDRREAWSSIGSARDASAWWILTMQKRKRGRCSHRCSRGDQHPLFALQAATSPRCHVLNAGRYLTNGVRGQDWKDYKIDSVAPAGRAVAT